VTHRRFTPVRERRPPIVLDLTDLYRKAMMTDLNVLISGSVSGSFGKPCIVQRTIDELQEPYKSKLRDLVDTGFADGGMTETSLAKLMQSAGLTCSATMISRHRRSVCTCPTER
jgi:hypothetical protein